MQDPDYEHPQEGDCWMAKGVEAGTRYNVTVYGKSREDVDFKLRSRVNKVEGVSYYTMPPHQSQRKKTFADYGGQNA